MVASSVLPFLDVITETLCPTIIGKTDVRDALITTDIWVSTLYLSPVLIIIASQLRPHIWSYQFPLFTFLYTAIMFFLPVLGFNIEPSIYTRILLFISVIPVTLIIKKIKDHSNLMEFEERVRDMALENLIND